MKITNFFSKEIQPKRLEEDNGKKINNKPSNVKRYCAKIDTAEGFNGIWEIVKDTVKVSLGKHRVGMLLFLDDLPLQLGAYHQLGTNNIVLNRTLVNIVDSVTESKKLVNAFVYSILTHEYLHALGHVSESEVRSLVYKISKKCFGKDHIVTSLAEKTPWSILKGVPLNELQVSKQPMELIKDLEKSDYRYIV